jgi:hypothetical protein
MKDTFQAKDIQDILFIPKHRYEYIASKIGIAPDVDEVDGQGRAHLYSFKNLLQFAFVHQANKLGLTPKAARRMLSIIDEFEKSEKFGVYDPNNLNMLSIHYVDQLLIKYFAISDSKVLKRIFFLDKDLTEDISLLRGYYDAYKGPKVDYEKFKETFGKVIGFFKENKNIDEVLWSSDGNITINLGIIKIELIKHRLINYR